MFLNVRFLGAELAVFGTIPAIDRDKRQRQQWLMTRPRPKRTFRPEQNLFCYLINTGHSTSKFTGLRGFSRRSGGMMGWAFRSVMHGSRLDQLTIRQPGKLVE